MESEGRVLKNTQTWSREEAERSFAALLAAAKVGRVQQIADDEGVFELTFKVQKGNAAEFLARGGPEE